jgi:hypothetical protein
MIIYGGMTIYGDCAPDGHLCVRPGEKRPPGVTCLMAIYGAMAIYGGDGRHKGRGAYKRGTAPHCAIGGSNPNGIESLRRAAPHGTHQMR